MSKLLEIQTDLKVENNKIRVKGYSVAPQGGISQVSKSETSILFEDISSLTKTNNSNRMIFIYLAIASLIISIILYSKSSYTTEANISLVSSVLFWIIFGRQPSDYLVIETRGGSKIAALYEGECSVLINEIENLRRFSNDKNKTGYTGSNQISLEKALELYRKGLISSEEFKKVKDKILGL